MEFCSHRFESIRKWHFGEVGLRRFMDDALAAGGQVTKSSQDLFATGESISRDRRPTWPSGIREGKPLLINDLRLRVIPVMPLSPDSHSASSSQVVEKMERETGVEPATFSLGS